MVAVESSRTWRDILESKADMTEAKVERRRVQANLIEATPSAGGLWHWILASPALLFLLWSWISLFGFFSPLALPAVNIGLGAIIFIVAIVLPFGYLAHRAITALPWLFQNAGWEIYPLEPVREAEKYLVRYDVQERQRATTNWSRIWMRAAQGWVFLEIAAIFAGAILMIPLFFSAVQFGFGR